MKEETAQESSFLSIFKDYAGRWYSENTSFISWTFVLQIGFLIVILSSAIIGFIDPNHAVGIIGSLCAGYGIAAAPILGLVTYQKRGASKIQNERLKKIKDQENA